jgi:hypothetical protein
MSVTYLPRVWMEANISPKLLPSCIQPLSGPTTQGVGTRFLQSISAAK